MEWSCTLTRKWTPTGTMLHATDESTVWKSDGKCGVGLLSSMLRTRSTRKVLEGRQHPSSSGNRGHRIVHILFTVGNPHRLNTAARNNMPHRFCFFCVRPSASDKLIFYASSSHGLSARTFASSSGVKSLSMLNVSRICAGVFPLIIDATFAHVRSRRGLISM